MRKIFSIFTVLTTILFASESFARHIEGSACWADCANGGTPASGNNMLEASRSGHVFYIGPKRGSQNCLEKAQVLIQFADNRFSICNGTDNILGEKWNCMTTTEDKAKALASGTNRIQGSGGKHSCTFSQEQKKDEIVKTVCKSFNPTSKNTWNSGFVGPERDCKTYKFDGRAFSGERLKADKCNWICDANGNWQENILTCKDCEDVKDIVKPGCRAESRRAGRPSLLACCDVVNATPNFNDGTCTCADGKPITITNGRGSCPIGNDDNDCTSDCSVDEVIHLENIIATTTNAEVKKYAQLVLDNCKLSKCFDAEYNRKKLDALLAQIEIDAKAKDEADKKAEEERIERTITTKITTTRATWDRIAKQTGTFTENVWRDKDGKFNKARLVSDSVAGVVLGTTGALITSHVMKKNQLKNGYEDIKCNIGGQNVADWGDEFVVGKQ